MKSLLSFISSLTWQQVIYVTTKLIFLGGALLFAILGVAAFAIWLFELRVTENKFSTGKSVRDEVRVVVHAAHGWQFTGIEVEKGQKLSIRAQGRVHIALHHMYNLTSVIKGFITKSSETGTRPSVVLRDDMPYWRRWNGPLGDPIESPDLQPCLLKTNANWGALLLAIFPTRVDADDNPLLVAEEQSVIPWVYQGESEWRVPATGFLHAVINEAVVSEREDSTNPKLGSCREQKHALEEVVATIEDANSNRHRMNKSDLNLLWYADNVGFFQLFVGG